MIRICRHFDYRESAIYTNNDITWFYDYDLSKSRASCVATFISLWANFLFSKRFWQCFWFSLSFKNKDIRRENVVGQWRKKTGSKSFVDFYGPRLPYEHIKLFIPRSLSTRILMLIRNLSGWSMATLRARVSATSCPTHFLS